MAQQQQQPLRLGLISMPWSIFNRPSIQLAALKAYVDKHHGDSIHCHLFHHYLTAAASLGNDCYHHLAKNSWAGEALYSPILYPEQKSNAKNLFQSSCRGNKKLQELDFEATAKLLEGALDNWLAGLDLSQFDLIGFSICFNQLLSSLTAARKIKELRPDLPIVFGGSGCVAEIGLSLLTNFSQIDYVINGEGEEALAELCLSLSAPKGNGTLSPRIMSRDSRVLPKSCPKDIPDLNQLPIPDYAPYFNEMKSIFGGMPFVPVLPLEFSRGCWWNKCKFCNLNLQWQGYRWKQAETMLQEVQQQSSRYQCLDFCFTDNALPPREADLFFNTLARSSADYDFFAEVRVLTDPDTPQRYRRGGLSSIQVGIEALSSSLLNKMQKGTSAIENIAAMRQSAEAGIQLDGNLIIEFPGSSIAEAHETMAALDYVLPYPPLSAASFFLGHGSPVAQAPQDYGILAITQHPKNRQLLPQKVLKELTMLIKGYRGDRGLQKGIWKEVKAKIAAWNSFHENRSSLRPALSYREGQNFLIIRQEQPLGQTLQHRLQGKSREMYLYCREIQSIEELCSAFPNIKEAAIVNFLQGLCDKKLMFRENNQFLALAIRGG